jgi:hypothetical protein
MIENVAPFKVGDSVVLRYPPAWSEAGDQNSPRLVSKALKLDDSAMANPRYRRASGFSVTVEDLPPCLGCGRHMGSLPPDLDSGWFRLAKETNLTETKDATFQRDHPESSA